MDTMRTGPARSFFNEAIVLFEKIEENQDCISEGVGVLLYCFGDQDCSLGGEIWGQILGSCMVLESSLSMDLRSGAAFCFDAGVIGIPWPDSSVFQDSWRLSTSQGWLLQIQTMIRYLPD
jgi:hypothetical protein